MESIKDKDEKFKKRVEQIMGFDSQDVINLDKKEFMEKYLNMIIIAYNNEILEESIYFMRNLKI